MEFFYVLCTAHCNKIIQYKPTKSIFSKLFSFLIFDVFYTSLDNDQLGAQLLYLIIRPLHSSTCFEH